jgi:hypothetical protein
LFYFKFNFLFITKSLKGLFTCSPAGRRDPRDQQRPSLVAVVDNTGVDGHHRFHIRHQTSVDREGGENEAEIALAIEANGEFAFRPTLFPAAGLV